MAHCPFDGGLIVRWETDRDAGWCPLGHYVTGVMLHQKGAVLLQYPVGSAPASSVEELLKLVDAQILSRDEARQVVLEWFPAARKLAEAKALVERG